MYESPIQLVMNDMYNQIQVEQENTVYKAIQSIGVNVDKDELIKALNYDQEQYQKGFDDGYRDGAKEIVEALKEKLCHYCETEYTFDFDGVTEEAIDEAYVEVVGENK